MPRQTLRNMAADPSMGNALEFLVLCMAKNMGTRQFHQLSNGKYQVERGKSPMTGGFLSCWIPREWFKTPRYASWTLTHGHRTLVKSVTIARVGTAINELMCGRIVGFVGSHCFHLFSAQN